MATATALYAQAGAFANIYSFSGGSDGGQPAGGLVANSSTGALYGGTQADGTGGGGTVFELSPPSTPLGSWTYKVIYNFRKSAGDGYDVSGKLVFGPDGALYGTTLFGGGPLGAGTVFRLAPPAVAGGAWTESILYTFNANRDGNTPGPVIFGPPGVLYGVLTYEGARQPGFGSVFQLRKQSDGSWKFRKLYNFTDNNAAYPMGILALDAAGAIYGTAEGTQTFVNPGSVYQLTPPTLPEGAWTYRRLYTFSLVGTDGLSPLGGVVFGLNGALYGTTAAGGTIGNGAIFALVPPSSPGGAWTETILYNFSGGSDGTFPVGGLTVNQLGVLFGVTEYGGAQTSFCSGCGTVFELNPPVAPATSWSLVTPHEFQGGPDGQQPYGPVKLGKDGSVYGITTGYQNTVNAGTVFQIKP